MRKPKLLKPQPRKVVLVSCFNKMHVICVVELPVVVFNMSYVTRQPKIAEESLTYAELELIKPLPEAKAAKTGTVYAQILFEDKPV